MIRWAIRLAFLAASIACAVRSWHAASWGWFGFWMFAVGEWWGKLPGFIGEWRRRRMAISREIGGARG